MNQLKFCLIILISCIAISTDVQAVPSPQQTDLLSPDRFEKIRGLLRSKRYQQVVRRIQEVDGSGDPELRLILGLSLARSGKCNEAVSHLKKAVNHHLLGHYALLWLTECYAATRQFDQAVQWGKELIVSQYGQKMEEEEPHFNPPLLLSARRLVGLSLYEEGKYEEAVKYLTLCCSEIPERSYDPRKIKDREMILSGLGLLAETQAKLGRQKRAVKYWKKILIQAPEDRTTGVVDRAETALKKRNIPFSKQERLASALSFASVFDYPQALKNLISLQASLSNREKDSQLGWNVQLELAKVEFAMRERKKAYALLKSLYRKAPTLMISYWLARTQSTLGMEREAISTYRKLASRFSHSAYAVEALYRIGGLHFHSKRYLKARREWGNLLKLYSKSGWADSVTWFIGWSYYLEKKYLKASSWFQRIERDFSTSSLVPQARYWRAQAMMSLGKKKKGVQLLRGLSSLRPLSLYHFLAAKKLNDLEHMLPKLSSYPPLSLSTATVPRDIARIQLLITLGLSREALHELDLAAREVSARDILLRIAFLYQRAGDYHQAMKLVSQRLSRHWQLVYPMAFQNLIKARENAHQVDPYLVLAIMRAESQYSPYATSPSGALGLLQLMPETANKVIRSEGMSFPKKLDLRDPASNITIASRYLKKLTNDFGKSPYLAIPSYNAGFSTVTKWVKRFQGSPLDEFIEKIPYRETRIYFRKVLRNYAIYHLIYGDIEKFYQFLSTSSARHSDMNRNPPAHVGMTGVSSEIN